MVMDNVKLASLAIDRRDKTPGYLYHNGVT